MSGLKGLFILDSGASTMVYGPEERADIDRLVEIYAPDQTKSSVLVHPAVLAEADVIFSGWGGPVLDADFLAAAPRLKAFFYGAGAVSSVVTKAAWERGVLVTSAYAANAVPVAEYTLATILFSLKHGWHLTRLTREQRRFPARDDAPGCYGSTVGLVSLGMIARTLLTLLRPFDLRVLVYDPFVARAEADRLGVELVSLDELFRRADVVSVHTPHLAETEGMITRAHVASMKPGATFINTARGEVVREAEMVDVLARRPDLQAVLDVTANEPPVERSPLYTLPNVVLTPHIAGSVGPECRRMGRSMVEELRRFIAGQPLLWSVTPELAARTSHRPRVEARPLSSVVIA